MTSHGAVESALPVSMSKLRSNIAEVTLETRGKPSPQLPASMSCRMLLQALLKSSNEADHEDTHEDRVEDLMKRTRAIEHPVSHIAVDAF